MSNNLLQALFLTADNPRRVGTSCLIIQQQSTTQSKKYVLLKLVSKEHFAGMQESQLLGVHSQTAMVFHIHSLRQCTSIRNPPTKQKSSNLLLLKSPFYFYVNRSILLLNKDRNDRKRFSSCCFKQQVFLPFSNY